jgi:NTP pyrophosphatase (non-canonical NTP hydrolase)
MLVSCFLFPDFSRDKRTGENMGAYQQIVKQKYIEQGYTDDLMTLALGLCEEAGEIAKAVNQMNPKYVKTPDREIYNLEHELNDLLVYLCGLANAAGIELGI